MPQLMDRITLKTFLRNYLFTAGLFIGIDLVWLVITQPFHDRAMGDLARRAAGDFFPLWWPAVLAYLIIPLGLTALVVNRGKQHPLAGRIGIGALYGACIYAVHNLSNYANLTHWSLAATVVDTLWGGAICAAVTWVVGLALKRLDRGPEFHR